MALPKLHITNGSVLTDYLNELDFKGEFLTWQEILCEGPTLKNIDSEAFFKKRYEFLSENYDVSKEVYDFPEQLKKLDNLSVYSEILLWFEYDLFCHINMCAVISLLKKKRCKLPIYLVCSGRIHGVSDLKGLGELNEAQLIQHYDDRVQLNIEDIDLADYVWSIYCGKDHNLFKPLLVKKSSFKYLSNCLKAHLKRFPDSKNGLSTLEYNVLKLLEQNQDIKSKHHLLGYILNYQGYYGFGDSQLERIIHKLSLFFDEDENSLKLNRKGHEALLGSHNFAEEINDRVVFGGVQKLAYQFNRTENKLIKTVINAD